MQFPGSGIHTLKDLQNSDPDPRHQGSEIQNLPIFLGGLPSLVYFIIFIEIFKKRCVKEIETNGVI